MELLVSNHLRCRHDRTRSAGLLIMTSRCDNTTNIEVTSLGTEVGYYDSSRIYIQYTVLLLVTVVVVIDAGKKGICLAIKT